MCKNEFKRNEVRKNTKTGIDHLYYVSSDTNLEKVIHEKQFKDALLEALDEMDEKHREVFILKHMDGLSIKEISEIMDIQEGTVKSRLFYAIKRLANQLKVYENV
jgi:RNA polymerase sigma-70 factor (ECF subfamily)